MLWKGNGLCDDLNNIAECDFDGGDCCGAYVKHGHCSDCLCKDPNEKKYEFSAEWTCQKELMHNGQCDRVNNVQGCRFDGYDCCQPGEASSVCKIGALCDLQLMKNFQCDEINNSPACFFDMGSCLVDQTESRDYLCLKDEALKGDGVCDLLNDVPECGRDGGDCNKEIQKGLSFRDSGAP